MAFVHCTPYPKVDYPVREAPPPSSYGTTQQAKGLHRHALSPRKSVVVNDSYSSGRDTTSGPCRECLPNAVQREDGGALRGGKGGVVVRVPEIQSTGLATTTVLPSSSLSAQAIPLPPSRRNCPIFLPTYPEEDARGRQQQSQSLSQQQQQLERPATSPVTSLRDGRSALSGNKYLSECQDLLCLLREGSNGRGHAEEVCKENRSDEEADVDSATDAANNNSSFNDVCLPNGEGAGVYNKKLATLLEEIDLLTFTGNDEDEENDSADGNARGEKVSHNVSRLTTISLPLVLPSACSAEEVIAPISLRWMRFLVEARRRRFESVSAFEDEREPRRSSEVNRAAIDACAGAQAALVCLQSHLMMCQHRQQSQQHKQQWGPNYRTTTSDIYHPHEELHGDEGDDEEVIAQERRALCAQVSNALAQLVSSDADVIAQLLNDAAAGATLERELQPSLVQSRGAVVNEATEEKVAMMKREMETAAALLKRLSDENAALKTQCEELEERRSAVQAECARVRDEKDELMRHYDRVAVDNAGLLHKLHATEVAERVSRERSLSARRSVGEEVEDEGENPSNRDAACELDAAREEYRRVLAQLNRQTSNVRDMRAQLEESYSESDVLRATVGRLRECIVRHRTVVDMLVRYCIPDDSGSGAKVPEPSREMIRDILSGVTALVGSEEDEGEESD